MDDRKFNEWVRQVTADICDLPETEVDALRTLASWGVGPGQIVREEGESFADAVRRSANAGLRPSRARVVAAAVGELGQSDSMRYWPSAYGKPIADPFGFRHLAWCGAFALWCLHQAELAADIHWELGRGFLYRLHMTREPKAGDVAYFQHLQHHAVVEAVHEDGRVSLINGNGAGGQVTRSTGTLGLVTAFYSIDGLLPELAQELAQ